VDDEGVRIVCRNRRARYLYRVETRFEAGIVLKGTEAKSLRAGQVDLSDAYAAFEDRELWLHNAHISEYKNAGYVSHEPKRTRLRVKISERGYTLVPLAVYFKGGYAKVELGLARGKRKFDRRESVRKRDEARDKRREEREASRRRR
jgi:SsrA-binding protein